MNTRRKHSPQYNTAGKRNDSVYTQEQHSGVPGRRADGEDLPFPNKPVSHRKPLNQRKQDSLDLYDLEQPSGLLLPQEHHSNGTRKTTGFQDPRKDSHRQPSEEVLLARAIHAKELMLQEKLWRVEEKIRQKIQRTACDDQRSEEQRQDSRRAEGANIRKSPEKASNATATEKHIVAERKLSGGQMLPPVSNPSHHSTIREQEELRQEDGTDTSLQFVPCTVCNRTFASENLQKHVQICKNLKSRRPVFKVYGSKGYAMDNHKPHSKSTKGVKDNE